MKEEACEDTPVVDATETSCPSNEVIIQPSENDDTQKEKADPPKSTNSKVLLLRSHSLRNIRGGKEVLRPLTPSTGNPGERE